MAKKASSKQGQKPREADGKSSTLPAAGPPPMSRIHIWQIQALRDLLWVTAVIAIVWVGYAMRAVTVPLLVALLLAYLFEPLVERMSRHPKISRAGAVSIVVVSFAAVVVVVVALALPFAVANTTRLVNDVRGGALHDRVQQLERFVPNRMEKTFDDLVELLPERAERRFERAVDGAAADAGAVATDVPAAPAAPGVAADADAGLTAEAIERIVDARVDVRLQERSQVIEADEPHGALSEWRAIASGIREAIQTVFGVVGAIVGAGLLAFLIPFYFFFFSLWYPDVLRFLHDLLPEKNRGRYLELFGKMDEVVAGFVRGRIVISIIMGILLWIGWAICGVPNALVVGMTVGIFCAVPYLGVVGIPLAVGLLFFDWLGEPPGERMAWYWVIIWPTAVFAVVQLIEGYILTPAIAGKATNLDPVTILVVVLAGGSIAGVYGMLLAIPVAACGKIICTDVLLPKIRAWTRGEAADPLPIDRE